MIKSNLQKNEKPNIDYSYMQNRELSWLKFNERVLEKAADDTVPVFERFRFISIFMSNLDEFFMIRVGSLHDMSLVSKDYIDSKTGMTAKEQISAIFKELVPLCEKKDLYFDKVIKKLYSNEIKHLKMNELEDEDRKYFKSYFDTNISPVLSPQIIDSHHPFPHIENMSLNILMMIKGLDKKNELRFAIIAVPKLLPRMIELPGRKLNFVLIEDVVLEFAHTLFESAVIVEKAIISIIRNADINPDDETYDFEMDYRDKMKQILKKRKLLSAVCLEIQNNRNPDLIKYLCQKLSIKEDQVLYSTSPLDLSYINVIEAQVSPSVKSKITYIPHEPVYPGYLLNSESIIKYVLKKDLLLHYPYESMNPFLTLIKEASINSSVLSIKITLYRINKNAKLIEYLIDAAENGKEVTVIIELRARFDEQNNIEWAERLSNAGCRVSYGIEGLKVHSKICLITLHDRNKLSYITQIGTGNYNEKTARLYTDFSLITSNEGIGKDAVEFFKNLLTSNTTNKYNHLLVAPNGLKTSILALIDKEIEKQKKCLPSGVFLKMNSLTDKDIIDKLVEASCAGVRIRMIIRGICCIIPGIESVTENISVVSIVGRFLEHSRIYCFGDMNRIEDLSVYISSADMMTRNTERRVEVACPVLELSVKSKIVDVIKLQLSDNVKSKELLSDGNYYFKDAGIQNKISCQEALIKKYISEKMTTSEAIFKDTRSREWTKQVMKLFKKFWNKEK